MHKDLNRNPGPGRALTIAGCAGALLLASASLAAASPAGQGATLSAYPTELGTGISNPGVAWITLDTGTGSGGEDVRIIAPGAYQPQSVVDHGDGTYTTMLVARDVPDDVTLSARVNDDPVDETVELSFVEAEVGPADAMASELRTERGSRFLAPVDASQGVTIRVEVRDALGLARQDGSDSVTMSATAGDLSDVSFNFKTGLYEATLSGVEESAEVVVSGAVNGEPIEQTATVVFTDEPLPASMEATLMTDPDDLYADGQSVAEVELALLDESEELFGSGGHQFWIRARLAQDANLASTVIDHGDGRYTARIVAPTEPADFMQIFFFYEAGGPLNWSSDELSFQSEVVLEDRFEASTD